MIPGLYTTTAGMINQQIMMEVITNNLANVNTIGYKRDDLNFSGMLNNLMDPVNPYYTQSLDTVSEKFVTDFSIGIIKSTDNPLDIAIDGDGFFVIQHDDGIRYTRSGNFSINSLGQLVTIDGYAVLGNNGIIQVANGKLEIDSQGSVIVDGILVDRLRIVDFPKPYQLIKGGYNTFINSLNQPIQNSSAVIKQGYIELSNANPIYEMVKMIETMRVYEAYQKTIQLFNETLEKSNTELGKVNA